MSATARPGYNRSHMSENAEAKAPERDDVFEALENVIDPELGLDFVSLGLVYDVEVEDRDVHITFTLTSPGCPIGPQVTEQMKEFVGELDGVERGAPEDDLLAALDSGQDERGRQVRARLLSRRVRPQLRVASGAGCPSRKPCA